MTAANTLAPEEAAEIEAATTEVYLDAAQCEALGVSYYDLHYWKSIRADRLLASKGGDGYDDYHFNLLGPMRAKTVRLARLGNAAPGWFKVLT